MKHFIATLFLYLYASVVAANDSVTLIEKMADSFRQMNYQGIVTYQQGDKLDSLRLAHAVIDNKEYERLEYLSGKKREIIRNGSSLDCAQSVGKLVRREGTKNLAKYYHVSSIGDDRVAGRIVEGVVLEPKDDNRLSHRLFLDKQTGLLLKSVLIGKGNKVLERFQFVDIEVNADIPMSHFGKNVDDAYLAIQANEDDGASAGDKATHTKQWQVAWLPDGFNATTSQCYGADEDMETFTDGVAVFSVFIEPVDKLDMAAEAQAQRGATCAYSKPLMLRDQPHRVTVVGEIPRVTAKKIAQSIILAES